MRYRKHHRGPARSKTRGMRGVSMRENREILCLPDLDAEERSCGPTAPFAATRE